MKVQKFDNVFDALYDCEQAIEMRRRAELASVLERFIQRRKLSQSQAAKLLGVSQPRINDLLRGRLHRFSVDALLNMMDHAEIQIAFKVQFPKAA
jgi:predicted XRE-type DNA-binding protein